MVEVESRSTENYFYTEVCSHAVDSSRNVPDTTAKLEFLDRAVDTLSSFLFLQVPDDQRTYGHRRRVCIWSKQCQTSDSMVAGFTKSMNVHGFMKQEFQNFNNDVRPTGDWIPFEPARANLAVA